MIVPSDKTSKFYEIPVSDYKKLLNDSIKKDYGKCTDKILKHINLETKNLTKNLKIHDRPSNFL